MILLRGDLLSGLFASDTAAILKSAEQVRSGAVVKSRFKITKMCDRRKQQI